MEFQRNFYKRNPEQSFWRRGRKEGKWMRFLALKQACRFDNFNENTEKQPAEPDYSVNFHSPE